MSHWEPYVVAVAIGLLVGIERERAHPYQSALGVRTFLCVSLLGAISGGLAHSGLSLVLALFTLGLILISYFTQTHSRSERVDRGLTTEFAAGIIFCLSYAAHSSPTLSASLGTIVAVILFSKSTLHRFTHAIKPAELKTGFLLLLGSIAVITLTPNVTIDPWNIFNPRKMGYIVISLGALEFLSYILAKIIGEKKGSLAIGFLGGIVSSTAVLLSAARQSNRDPMKWRNQLCSTLAAIIAALLEVLFIVGLIAPSLWLRIGMPLGGGLILGSTSLLFLTINSQKTGTGLTLKTPLDWIGVFRLSIVFGGILIAISVAKLWLGESSALTISFLTGLFELHGVSLVSSTMYAQGTLAESVAVGSIILASIASIIAKLFIAWAITRGPFSRWLSAILVSMAIAIALIGWLTYDLSK